ncbi:hypothetical protein Slin15195_G087490 [Septoria linicola]|uniref:Uncharacterized protein n=1 Tax=Septoria linicola TaxID=215465 RepID=A0A9Q9AUL3_9PEZI|nr:hypothetical protein Slin14017_G090080 [Septoria linicola]USW55430.1 hypothetical protein Slin15195_G087490 [Septoria linicola]
MAVGQEYGQQIRRRARTYGWFDHGDRSLFPLKVRPADRLTDFADWKLQQKYKLERYLPTIRVVLLVVTRILATIAILGPAVIIGTASLRGTQLLCQREALSRDATVCNNAWMKSQQTVLYDLPANKTPMTTTIAELSTLNTLSPSLEFLGLPLFESNLKLSTVLGELEEWMNKTQLELLRPHDIRNAGAQAHELVESFSSKDANFRRITSSWDDHGIDELQYLVSRIGTIVSTRREWFSTSRESIYHVLPFLSKQTLSYKLLLQYHKFVSNHQNIVKELVMEVTEARLLLQNFLSQIHHLERQLNDIAPTLAEDLITIRLSTAWALQVVQFVEVHYKTMYSSLHAWSVPLETDVASYDSWWLSTTPLPLSRRGIIEMESRQLEKYSVQVKMVDEAMDLLYDGFIKGGNVAAAIRYKLDAAARKGTLNWL